jgi:hypothetical protein
MNSHVPNELVVSGTADIAATVRQPYRNPLRGEATFHEHRDLARVIARLRALAPYS